MTEAILPAALQPGLPHPMGASFHNGTFNMAVWAPHATRIWLCLHGPDRRELQRMALPARTDGVWHGALPDAPGRLIYSLCAEGPGTAPHAYDARRPLLDPYARRLFGEHDAATCVPPLALALRTDHEAEASPLECPAEQGPADARPAVPMADTVLYEVHVKGLSALHPAVPPDLRGSWLGVCHPALIAHFRRLGVTTLSLLPVHAARDETPLRERGLTNYWGYNTVAFFTPNPRYTSRRPGVPADPVQEFRTMVRTLHQAGLEVVIDVVYNHTGESGLDGPTLSWRGLDNAAWYRHRSDQAGVYEDFTGCGNTLDVSRPRVLQFVLDSLRHWATHFGVDGFRFDLAPVLGRDRNGFSNVAPFFQAIAQDPVLAPLKLIAEPWDLGPGGYQCGSFPAPWSQWNDRYRGTARAFWLLRAASPMQMAERVAGSMDIAAAREGLALASVNYFSAHDGFTLEDLVSYGNKRNEANGEDNRDGTDDNRSWNCGVEGPTDLLAVRTVRARLKRALLTTLFVSRGVPMLLGGDELGRTQQGNNNAYCQDGPISWYDWQQADQTLIDFSARLIALRRRFPSLRGERTLPVPWLVTDQASDPASDPAAVQPSEQAQSSPATGDPATSAQWLDGAGQTLPGACAGRGDAAAFSLLLRSTGAHELLVLFNPQPVDHSFPLPPGCWSRLLDSAIADGGAEGPVEPRAEGPVEPDRQGPVAGSAGSCRTSARSVQILLNRNSQPPSPEPAAPLLPHPEPHASTPTP